jgi:hypothetical protein
VGKNVIKPVLITGIILSIIVLLIIVYFLFEFHIQKFLWNINRPATYYLELKNGDYYSSIMVSDGKVVQPGNTRSPASASIFTLDDLYDLAYINCIEPPHDCIIKYDPQFHFISGLAIYDTRVIRIARFIPCQSVEDCVQKSGI